MVKTAGMTSRAGALVLALARRRRSAAAVVAVATALTVAVPPGPALARPGQAETDESLSSVSCPAAGTCEAVGTSYNGTSYLAGIADAWNGTTWVSQSVPDPTGEPFELAGVDCPEVTHCVAVGSYTNGSGSSTLVEVWNGHKWSIQASPDPSSPYPELESVSCYSKNACVAVGQDALVDNDDVAFSETWNGKTWTTESMAFPVSGTTYTNAPGVSCPKPAYCEAAGWYVANSNPSYYHYLAYRWNGKSWKIQLPPNGKSIVGGILQNVSCATVSDCEAVGYNSSPSNTVTSGSAEVWNGRRWSVQPTSLASQPGGSDVLGVWCAPSGSCEAAGYIQQQQNPELATLTMAWNGTSWTTQSSPNASGTQYDTLGGVSCATLQSCEAVGSSQTGVPNQSATLAEGWNGSAWSLQPTPG
jgi:hypothetical protein